MTNLSLANDALGSIAVARPSTLGELPTRLSYSLDMWDFPRAVATCLGVEDLQHLRGGDSYRQFTRENDQRTPIHEHFYGGFSQALGQMYSDFVRREIAPLFEGPICYQRVPTFRVHLPGNVAVGEFHTDAEYFHQDGEVNFWVPLTPAWGSNTVWVAPPNGDHTPLAPVEARPGEMFVFDAVRTWHGNLPNATGSARVSFDLRVIPLARYQPSKRRSVNAKRRLVLGDYFALFRPEDARGQFQAGVR